MVEQTNRPVSKAASECRDHEPSSVTEYPKIVAIGAAAVAVVDCN